MHARSRSSRARRTNLHRLQHVVLGALRMHRTVRARGLHRGLSHTWRIGLGATRMSAGRCSHTDANTRTDGTRCARTRRRAHASTRAHTGTRAHRRADAFARTRRRELELPGFSRVFVVDGRDARRVCVACLDASPQGEVRATQTIELTSRASKRPASLRCALWRDELDEQAEGWWQGSLLL